MKCSICGNDPSYVCMFCGRIICENCKHYKPHIMAAFDETGDDTKVLVTEDATWCGKCHPTPNPIDVPSID